MTSTTLNKFYEKFLEIVDLRNLKAQACCRSAFSITFASLLAILFQTSIPYWASISAAVVSLNYYQASVNKAVLRIVGTIAGASLGAVLSYVVGDNQLLFLVITSTLIGLGFYLSQTSRFSYAFFMCGITAVITLATHFASHMDVWLAAYDRSLEISLGVLSALFCSRFIFFNDAEEEFKNNLSQLYDLLIQMINANNLTTLLSFRKELKNLITKDQKLIDIFFNDIKTLNITNHQAEQLFQTQKNLLAALEYFFRLGVTTEIACPAELCHIREVLTTLLMSLKNNNFDEFIKLYNNNHHAIFRNNAHPSQYYFELYEIIFIHISAIEKILTKQSSKLPSLKPWYKMGHAREIVQQNLMFTFKAVLSFFVATSFWFNFGGVAAVQGLITTLVLVPQKNIFDQANMAKQRVYGAILGAIIGLMVMRIFPYHLNTMTLLVFFAGWIFSYLYLFGNANVKSIAMQANVAFIIATVHINSLAAHAQLIQRLWGVTLGVGVILIINWLIWPQHPRTLLKFEMKKIILIYQSLLPILLDPAEQKTIKIKFEELNWRFNVCKNLLESMANLQGIRNRNYHVFSSILHRLYEVECFLYVWWLLAASTTPQNVVYFSEHFYQQANDFIEEFSKNITDHTIKRKQLLKSLIGLKKILRLQATQTTN